MERIDVEKRLRGSTPGEVDAPGWVRTRVLSRIESESQAQSRSWRPFVMGGSIGLAAACALVLGAMLWPTAGVRETTGVTEPPAGWASSEPVRVDLPKVDNIRAIEPMHVEARRLQDDAQQIASLVRVPISKLHGVLSRNCGRSFRA